MVIIESKIHIIEVRDYNYFIGFWNEISCIFMPVDRYNMTRMINCSMANVEINKHKICEKYYSVIPRRASDYKKNNRTLIQDGVLLKCYA